MSNVDFDAVHSTEEERMSRPFVTRALGAGTIVALALFVIPIASGDVPRMGDQRVGLGCALVAPFVCPDITLTAGEPFFVAHGAAGESIADILNPLRRFELSVDGQQVHGAIDLTLDWQSGLGDKWYVFNFPRGMAGTHSFTGCWFETDGSLTTCGTRVVHFV